jgi:SpoVK/Ycf46/Vps4 family AAA+-type ATPase
MPLFGGKKEELDALFKFKDLRIYCDNNSLAQDARFYRTVFDESEVNYLYFEVTLFNKKFDEGDWDGKGKIICHLLEGGVKTKEMCNLEVKLDVKSDVNVITLREGWGMENKGSYWKKGVYIVEAWVEDKMVGSKSFYCEDEGPITAENNPYFSLDHVKLFNASYNPPAADRRKYLTEFKWDATQYIWVEYKITNKVATEWNFEVYLNFYEKAGLQKSQLYKYYAVQAGKKDFAYTFDSGWGHDQTGTWKPGHYVVQIVCMGTMIAAIPFVVGENEVEGDAEVIMGTSNAPVSTSALRRKSVVTADAEPVTVEEALKEIDELIGLTNVKNEIKEQINYLNFAKLRKEKGVEEDTIINLHSVFTGNPGTGKTTIVNMLGKVYKSMGLLSKGHVIEVDRADLVGEYIGQTAPRVKKQIDAARGGILFVDEAYALARKGDTDGKDYGREVIEILLKEMSDGAGDIAIMVAGYPEEMGHFLNSNPGMKSRFGQYFHFEDYLPEELMKISDLTASKKNVTLSETANKVLQKKLVELYRDRDRNFGNARLVTSIISESKQNMAVRCMQDPNVKDLSKEQLSTIEAQDILETFADDVGKKLKLAVDDELLKTALEELNALVGLNNIKTEVLELSKLVKYYRDIDRDVLNKFSLHAVFLGNPGTGKTTVARIMAKIYKALGLLERGHLVEVDREELVAGYVGQTAIKTKDILDKAMGGVLFIDEAYALVGEGNDMGHEAVETLLKVMEDKRGQFSVIVAGYTGEMIEFLESNPGLKSRFDNSYEFVDYTMDELYQIALNLLEKENLTPDDAAAAHIREYLQFLYDKRDKHFGNARDVRKMIEKAVRAQNLRMASLEKAQRTEQMIFTLTFDDVDEFKFEDSMKKKGIGFGG